MPLTRAPQYNEEAAPPGAIFTNYNPERLRAESVTGSYGSRGALVPQSPPRSRGGLFRRHSSDSVPSNSRIVSAPHPPPSLSLGGSTLAHQPTARHTAGGGTIARGYKGQVHDKRLLAAREKVRLAEMAERGADR